MSAADDPIGEDEAVLRLIHPTYFKAGLPFPVAIEAFRPTANDDDGLSVFRERDATPEQILAALPEGKRDLYYVARIPVRELTKLGLSVRPSPIPEAPGHAVIPELNTESYQQDKVAAKEVQARLAALAAAAIVRTPKQP